MDKENLKRLIAGYLAGTLSVDERLLLQQWYDSFGEEEMGVPTLEREGAAKHIENDLLLHARRMVLVDGLNGDIRRPKWRRWQPLVAAAVLVITFGTLLWQIVDRNVTWKAPKGVTDQPIFRTVKTGVKQLKKLTLADSSVIYVNANSVIRIPENLKGKKREIFLDEGEAYFEVKRASQHPFVVHMGKGLLIEVLGTAFNVKSYAKLEDVSVAVGQGKVRVSDTLMLCDDLRASESIRYRKADGHIWKIKADPESIGAWVKGRTQLEEASFMELALVMHNLYGIRLKSTDPAAKTYRYNLNLGTDYSLKETMDAICEIHKTNYRRNGNEITIYP